METVKSNNRKIVIDYLEVVEFTLVKNNENRVLNEFAKRLKVTPKQILEHNKTPYFSEIRQLYCKLRSEMHGISYSETAREIGRTHTSVINGVKRINDLLFWKDRNIVKMWNRVKDTPGMYQ